MWYLGDAQRCHVAIELQKLSAKIFEPQKHLVWEKKIDEHYDQNVKSEGSFGLLTTCKFQPKNDARFDFFVVQKK